MDILSSALEANGMCRGFTLPEIEAWAEAHIQSEKGKLFGAEVPDDFNLSATLRDMASTGQIRECDRHRGHYLVSLRIRP